MDEMNLRVIIQNPSPHKSGGNPINVAKMRLSCSRVRKVLGSVFMLDSTSQISYNCTWRATEERHFRSSSLSFSLDLFSFWLFIIIFKFLLFWKRFVRRRSHCNSRWQINTMCFYSFHISFVIYLFFVSLFHAIFLFKNHASFLSTRSN